MTRSAESPSAVATDRHLVGFDTRELEHIQTDVLVIGGGVAGLNAAMTAAEYGDVLVLHKDALDRSNTSWAQGGIAAALGPGDDPGAHAADTLRTGCGLCDAALVERITAEAPAAVARLAEWGARFDEDARRRGFALGREGGHGAARILHSGDGTGAECARALVARVRADTRIREMGNAFVIDLLTDGDHGCVGALVQLSGRSGGSEGRHGGVPGAGEESGASAGGRTGVGATPDRIAVFARAVVLATGGAGRLYRETSNVPGATGDGIAAAYRAGATLKDMEFVQFHPTTLYLAGVERVLVTEAVRGDGALLIDNHGNRFLPAAHPDAELAPRDVVSRAVLTHLGRDDVTGVFLDMRHWPQGHVSSRFPGLARTCAYYGLDPTRDPIPVRPAAHYTIGGVSCDHLGQTDLPGLFACGEAACSGLHGANRLASNSLLEGLVLGPVVGEAAARAALARKRFAGELRGRPAPGERVPNGPPATDLADLRRALVSRMWRSAGVARDAGGLDEAAEAIGEWGRFLGRLDLERSSRRMGQAPFELANLLLLGRLVVAAASARCESRGTHGRLDHPERDDAGFLGSFLWRNGNAPYFAKKRRTEGAGTGSMSAEAEGPGPGVRPPRATAATGSVRDDSSATPHESKDTNPRSPTEPNESG